MDSKVTSLGIYDYHVIFLTFVIGVETLVLDSIVSLHWDINVICNQVLISVIS